MFFLSSTNIMDTGYPIEQLLKTLVICCFLGDENQPRCRGIKPRSAEMGIVEDSCPGSSHS